MTILVYFAAFALIFSRQVFKEDLFRKKLSLSSTLLLTQMFLIGSKYFLKIVKVLEGEDCQFLYRVVMYGGRSTRGIVLLSQMPSFAYCKLRLVVSMKVGIADVLGWLSPRPP